MRTRIGTDWCKPLKYTGATVIVKVVRDFIAVQVGDVFGWRVEPKAVLGSGYLFGPPLPGLGSTAHPA
jgi:hypothetical protein